MSSQLHQRNAINRLLIFLLEKKYPTFLTNLKDMSLVNFMVKYDIVFLLVISFVLILLFLLYITISNTKNDSFMFNFKKYFLIFFQYLAPLIFLIFWTFSLYYGFSKGFYNLKLFSYEIYTQISYCFICFIIISIVSIFCISYFNYEIIKFFIFYINACSLAFALSKSYKSTAPFAIYLLLTVFAIIDLEKIYNRTKIVIEIFYRKIIKFSSIFLPIVILKGFILVLGLKIIFIKEDFKIDMKNLSFENVQELRNYISIKNFIIFFLIFWTFKIINRIFSIYINYAVHSESRNLQSFSSERSIITDSSKLCLTSFFSSFFTVTIAYIIMLLSNVKFDNFEFRALIIIACILTFFILLIYHFEQNIITKNTEKEFFKNFKNNLKKLITKITFAAGFYFFMMNIQLYFKYNNKLSSDILLSKVIYNDTNVIISIFFTLVFVMLIEAIESGNDAVNQHDINEIIENYINTH